MTETPALWPAPNPTQYGTRHSVSSGHHLASWAAAFALLESRDNAVDSGCAAGMALAAPHADGGGVTPFSRNARTGFLESAADPRQLARAVVA